MKCRVTVPFVLLLLIYIAPALRGQQPAPQEADFTIKDFAFRSGETLPELRLHYTTFGKLSRNPQGRVTNAVLILHGTGGLGRQFLPPIFLGGLFGPRPLLDPAPPFIIFSGLDSERTPLKSHHNQKSYFLFF